MEINKLDENIYEIAQTNFNGFEMKVPVHIYANDNLLEKIKQDRTLDQIRNVATLKGIRKHAIALSDAHQGYGFCIGGVAGTDAETGVVSPGGVGYDINCGVRLLRTNISLNDIKKKLGVILDKINKNIPSGLGSEGKINLKLIDLNQLADNGLNWALEKDFAIENDINHCEENGFLEGADSSTVSKRAKKRGIGQVGSLGSGNHFLEIQRVDHIYNKVLAKKLGICNQDQVTLMIHTGSRAFGHQICTDSLRKIEKAMKRYKIRIPDRELACVPANTKEAQNYFKQMACAANFGFCNRQLITHWLREIFESVYNTDFEDMNMHLIYDVCHNILKVEEHEVEGKKYMLNVHRKGATRAFPKNHPDIPEDYQSIGQPVLIPGTMGTSSYLCIGKPSSMNLTFGSTAHGAGRKMSRRRADRKYQANEIRNNLYKRGIIVRGASMRVIAEESPGAYKDIDQVVQVNHDLGIIEKVAKMVPLAVVKG